MPLVVGAKLEAELRDRPLAVRLRDRIAPPDASPVPRDAGHLQPIVCTDLWYLNDDALRLQPTIAIGRPEDNAATAFLAGRLPTAFVAEDSFRIQFDPELIDLHVCLWGQTTDQTEAAIGLFIDRYLNGFLEAARRLTSG